MAVALLAPLLVFAASPLAAQVVRGRLLEAYSDQPIDAATVTLTSVDGQPLGNTVTDARGAFSLTVPGPGRYLLHAARIGYLSSVEGPIDVGAGDTLSAEFRIPLAPVQLDSVRVDAEMRSPRLERTGFYERQRRELGHFITREDIVKRNPVETFDLFRTVRGVHVIVRGNGSSAVIMRGGFGHSIRRVMCYPRMYVNGVLMATGAGGGAADLIRDFPPWEIEGIEIYRGAAEVPAQYGGAQSSCGVILLWTR